MTKYFLYVLFTIMLKYVVLKPLIGVYFNITVNAAGAGV